MSVEERMTLCNMVVEAGAKNGLIGAEPREGRLPEEGDLATAAPAGGDRSGLRVPARRSRIAPRTSSSMVAKPHRLDNVTTVSQLRDESALVHQVYVGSCTGAKYDDISVVASILEGKRIADGVRMVVVPASMAIYKRIVSSGVATTLMDAGAVIESPGCKACCGAHGGVTGDNEVGLGDDQPQLPRAHGESALVRLPVVLLRRREERARRHHHPLTMTTEVLPHGR